MKRPLLLASAMTVAVLATITAKFTIDRDRRVDALEALRSTLEQTRAAVDSCSSALALEQEGFLRLDGVVDSLRTAMEGLEDPAQGGVPEAVYPEYLRAFELYNDSVDAWQPRADSLRASEGRCRALVESHNQLSDSIRRMREEMTGDPGQSDISFFVLVKSSNYAQNSSGELTLLNHHFFSEIFLRDGGRIDEATLTVPNRALEPMAYEDRGSNFYVEGGHFDTLEELDTGFPNGIFEFHIKTPSVRIRGEEFRLAGPQGETALPDPITITLFQSDEAVSPLEVVPDQDLTIRWSEYSGGAEDPRGIVDDMIFVVVADCHGERVFHTGLPFQGPYLTYRTTEISVPASTLESGHPYSMFVEFPRVVDSRVTRGVPGFTSFATATYLDFSTRGPILDTECPKVSPPMDTGQTDRMEKPSGGSTIHRPTTQPAP